MILELYCTCGQVLKATVNRRKAQQAKIVWFNAHSGEGHSPTDAAGAELARLGRAGREAERQARTR